MGLKEIGVQDDVGISDKKSPPLVIAGDIFNQPFGNNTSNFVFSWCGTIELSKRPANLALEISRIMKSEGFESVLQSPFFLELFRGFMRNRHIDRFDSSAEVETFLQKEGGHMAKINLR